MSMLVGYEKYKASVPDTKTPVSFSLFVDTLRLKMEKRPDITGIADKFNAKFYQNCQRLLVGLPEDARVPLQMLFDRVMPSFAEGISKEFIHWFFDQIKTENWEEESSTRKMNEIEHNHFLHSVAGSARSE